MKAGSVGVRRWEISISTAGSILCRRTGWQMTPAITHQFAPLTLYRNTVKDPDRAAGVVHHWVGLAMRGDGEKVSREAVGTQVFLSYRRNGRSVRQMREVQIANGFSAQNDRRLLFGLGDYAGPVEIEVHW